MNDYSSNDNNNNWNKIDISVTDKTFISSFNKAEMCCSKVFDQHKLTLNSFDQIKYKHLNSVNLCGVQTT